MDEDTFISADELPLDEPDAAEGDDNDAELEPEEVA